VQAEIIGAYQVLEELGRGGMGVVYRARHQELGREAALKVLLYPEADLLERFAVEARSVAALRHAQVVRLYEAGIAGGRPFLAFELVDGEGLDAVLRTQGPLPPARAAALVRQVAEGIAHAHERGVLHRDLKPANVLLDRDGRARITDFGLALLLERDAERLTETGTMLGTPGYAAPELLSGEPSELGPAVDVYGLGALLYALLSGRPPFRAATALATAAQVVSRPVDLAPLGSVPAELSAIVARCLAKVPTERFGSAAEVATALRDFREEGLRQGAQGWRKAAVVGLALALGSILVATHVGPPSSGRPPATQAASPARSSSALPRASQKTSQRAPRFDLKTCRWRQRTPARRLPRRELHSAVFDGRRVLVWGGRANERLLNDLWAWNGVSWECLEPGGEGGEPTGRYGHAAVWDRARGRLLLFGGKNDAGTIDEVWEWSPAGYEQKRTGASTPGRRAFHSVAYSEDGVYLCGGARDEDRGGETRYTLLGDLWCWREGRWDLVQIEGPSAEFARENASLLIHGQRLLRFGGKRHKLGYGDLWAWDLRTGGWALASEEGVLPNPWPLVVDTGAGVLIFDQGSRRCWLWTAQGWRGPTVPVGAPGPRQFASLTWDSARGVAVLIGGRSMESDEGTPGARDPVLAEVWELETPPP